MKMEQPSIGLFVELFRYVNVAVVSVLKSGVNAHDFFSLISSREGEKFTGLLKQAMEAFIKNARLIEYNPLLPLWRIVRFNNSIPYSPKVDKIFFEALSRVGVTLEDGLKKRLFELNYQGQEETPRELMVGMAKTGHLCFGKIKPEKNLFNDNEYNYQQIREMIKILGGKEIPLELVSQVIASLPGPDSFLLMTNYGLQITRNNVIIENDGVVNSDLVLCYLLDHGVKQTTKHETKIKNYLNNLLKIVKQFFITL